MSPTATATAPSDAQLDLLGTAPGSAPLPAQPISAEVLAEKYAKGDETTPDEVRLRVAEALAQAEPPEARALWTERFLDAQMWDAVTAAMLPLTSVGIDWPAANLSH